MSSSFPPEIFDLIVDDLRDKPTTLKACCTVSKSWVPRARRYLFSDVEISQETPIERWVKAFRDPSNSPSHHTRVLSLHGFKSFIAASTYARDWVRSFSRIVELNMTSFREMMPQDELSFVQFHGFSPSLKSLSLYLVPASPQELLNLICSFPLLETLRVERCGGNTTTDGWKALSNSPKLTGSLLLDDRTSTFTRVFMRGLLDLPNGLRFSQINIRCPIEDFGLVTRLVLKCNDTPESICIDYISSNNSGAARSIDLSEAKKLKDLEFRSCGLNVRWITSTILTVKSENIQQITFDSDTFVKNPIGEMVRQEWRELDRALVGLWTSHSMRPKFTFRAEGWGVNIKHFVPALLSELTKMGAIDVVGLEPTTSGGTDGL